MNYGLNSTKFRRDYFGEVNDPEKLKRIAHATLELFDKGQDLVEVVIDKAGEVVDCNLQRTIWLGKIIVTEEIAPGKVLWFSDSKHMVDTMSDFIIKDVRVNAVKKA